MLLKHLYIGIVMSYVMIKITRTSIVKRKIINYNLEMKEKKPKETNEWLKYETEA